MLTFQQENWEVLCRDAQDIFPIHWQELALNKDTIKLDLNLERYKEIDAANALHVVTVRDDGKLVGYFVAFILNHMHYLSAGLMAYTDIYYVLPEFRVGGTGAKLICEVERTLKERGVVKFYLSCKLHMNHSELFKFLGFSPSDLVFVKLLKA